MNNIRLINVLRNGIVAYEYELDQQDYPTEEEEHRVLLNEFGLSEQEYQEIIRPQNYKSEAEMYDARYGKAHGVAVEIVEMFEDLLDEHGMMIPDPDRRGDEGEAPIYGCTWGNLVDQIAEHLEAKYESDNL